MLTQVGRLTMALVGFCLPTDGAVGIAKEPSRPPTSANSAKVTSGKKPKEFSIPGRRGLGTIRWDQKTVHAIDIDPEKLKRLYSVRHITIKDQPLLWMNEKRDVVGDRRYLSDLQVVRYYAVRDLKKEDRGIVIGKVTAGIDLPPLKVVELLICSEIVRCKSMALAGAKLDSEQTDEDGYHAMISGSDTYFTNEKRTVSFRFGIRIDKDGTIRMTKE